MTNNPFVPNSSVSRNMFAFITTAWIVTVAMFWLVLTVRLGKGNAIMPLIPAPQEVLRAFFHEWHWGSGTEMLKSLFTSLESIAWAAGIGLTLSYLATIPALRPAINLIGWMRYLSLIGISLVFMLLSPNDHILKVSLLTFSIVTFFVHSMLTVIDTIPEGRFDHARTQGLSAWGVTREVVIRGTLAEAFDTLRMNAAMAWMMLTMVEGIARSEGGIGVLLLNLNREQGLASIFAIQIMIFVVGIVQDLILQMFKHLVCPYAKG